MIISEWLFCKDNIFYKKKIISLLFNSIKIYPTYIKDKNIHFFILPILLYNPMNQSIIITFQQRQPT